MADIVQLKTYYDGTAHYSFRTTLDGVDYQIEMDWNSRAARWYLTLRSAEGDLLMSNRLVLANWPMLRFYHHRSGFPAGELAAISLQLDDAPPGLYELGVGQRCTLTYFPVGTVTA